MSRNEELEPLARRLEQLRRERRLTQAALAQRAGISTNHYVDLAHARANPTVAVLLHLARALGVSPGDLFEPAPPSDTCRMVLVADLHDLVASHRPLAGVVARLAKRARRDLTRHAQE